MYAMDAMFGEESIEVQRLSKMSLAEIAAEIAELKDLHQLYKTFGWRINTLIIEVVAITVKYGHTIDGHKVMVHNIINRERAQYGTYYSDDFVKRYTKYTWNKAVAERNKK